MRARAIRVADRAMSAPGATTTGAQAAQARDGHQFCREHPLRQLGSGVFYHRGDPNDLGEQRCRLGPGAVVGGHGIDEGVAVVQQQRHQPIDAVTSDGRAGRALGEECPPLTFEDGLQRRTVGFRGAVDSFADCVHREHPTRRSPAILA
jgi:hypothetical protein